VLALALTAAGRTAHGPFDHRLAGVSAGRNIGRPRVALTDAGQPLLAIGPFLGRALAREVGEKGTEIEIYKYVCICLHTYMCVYVYIDRVNHFWPSAPFSAALWAGKWAKKVRK